MQNPQIGRISNFIWSVADEVLRDLYVRGKYELVSNVVEIASRWFSSSSGDCPLEAHRQLGQDTVLEPRSIHQQAHKVSASVQRTPALTQPE